MKKYTTIKVEGEYWVMNPYGHLPGEYESFGPYETKKQAELARVGMERFRRRNKDLFTEGEK